MVGASLYPQANASLRSTRQRFSEDGTVPPPIAGSWQTINDVSLGVSYELDFWGKNRAAVDAALGRAHAAEVDLQAARLMLTTALARTYLRLDLAYAQRDLAQDTLKQREQTLELTRKRVAAQIDSQLELTQAEAALPADARAHRRDQRIDCADQQPARRAARQGAGCRCTHRPPRAGQRGRGGLAKQPAGRADRPSSRRGRRSLAGRGGQPGDQGRQGAVLSEHQPEWPGRFAESGLRQFSRCRQPRARHRSGDLAADLRRRPLARQSRRAPGRLRRGGGALQRHGDRGRARRGRSTGVAAMAAAAGCTSRTRPCG